MRGDRSTIDALRGIREAVVVVRSNTAGDRRLVALFDRAFGSKRPLPSYALSCPPWLPEHMIPAAFVMLKRCP